MAGDNPPNNLLDQRDQLLLTLSQQVKIEVTQEGSIVNVSFAKGEPLVLGAEALTLKPMASPGEPDQVVVGQDYNGSTTILGDSDLAGGGVLGGLLQFGSQSLKPVKNALGQIAIGLAAGIRHGAAGRTANLV